MVVSLVTMLSTLTVAEPSADAAMEIPAGASGRDQLPEGAGVSGLSYWSRTTVVKLPWRCTVCVAAAGGLSIKSGPLTTTDARSRRSRECPGRCQLAVDGRLRPSDADLYSFVIIYTKYTKRRLNVSAAHG
jgi:hypothetical protein